MAIAVLAARQRTALHDLAPRLLRIGAIIVTVWCCLRWVIGIPLSIGAGNGGVDYRVFRASAVALLQGANPYVLPSDILPNLNHPAIALLAVPFAVLPEGWGYAAWLFASTACYFLALGLAIATIGIPRSIWCRPLPLVLALTYAGFAAAIFVGQISPFLALLLVVAWALARRGRFSATACAIGALIALKLTFLPLAALIVARLVWREIAALGLGASIVTLAALPFVGIQGYRHWLTSLSNTDYPRLHTTNMSAIGLLYRVAPEAPRMLAVLGIVAACIIGVAVAYGRTARGWHEVDWRVAVLTLVALLSSPISWDHYGPCLIPTAAIAVMSWPSASRQVRILLACAAICLLGALDFELLLGAAGLPTLHSGTILCVGLFVALASFLCPRNLTSDTRQLAEGDH